MTGWKGHKAILHRSATKKQNRMVSENLGILLFLAVLKLKTKDYLDYKAERNMVEIVQFDLK